MTKQTHVKVRLASGTKTYTTKEWYGGKRTEIIDAIKAKGGRGITRYGNKGKYKLFAASSIHERDIRPQQRTEVASDAKARKRIRQEEKDAELRQKYDVPEDTPIYDVTDTPQREQYRQAQTYQEQKTDRFHAQKEAQFQEQKFRAEAPKNWEQSRHYKTQHDVLTGKLKVPQGTMMGSGGTLYTGGQAQVNAFERKRKREYDKQRETAQLKLATDIEKQRQAGGTVRPGWKYEGKGKQMVPEYKVTNYKSVQQQVSSAPVDYSTKAEREAAAIKERQRKSAERTQSMRGFSQEAAGYIVRGAKRVEKATIDPFGIIAKGRKYAAKKIGLEKDITRKTTGNVIQYTSQGGFMLGEGAARVADKFRFLISNRKELDLSKSNFVAPLKDKEFKKTFDPRSAQGLTTYVMASGGAYLRGTLKARSPPKVPKNLKGQTSRSYKYTVRETFPTQSKLGRTGGKGVKTVDLIKHDTHTFKDINMRTGKVAVEVFRGQKGRTGVTQVKVGKTTYSNIVQKGRLGGKKVAAVKSVPSGKPNIAKVTGRVTKFSAFGKQGSTFPFKRNVKLPRYKEVERTTEKVGSEYDYIQKGNKMTETRKDIYSVRRKFEAKTGRFSKSIIEDRSIIKQNQVAKTKASQVLKTDGLKINTIGKNNKMTSYDVPQKIKGQYPDVRFGKLRPPEDFSNVKRIWQLPKKDGGRVEFMTYDKIRGSRLVKNVNYQYRDKGYRTFTKKSTFFDKVKILAKDKRAQAKIGKTKSSFINIGGKLKPSQPSFTKSYPSSIISGATKSTFSGAFLYSPPTTKTKLEPETKQREAQVIGTGTMAEIKTDPMVREKFDQNYQLVQQPKLRQVQFPQLRQSPVQIQRTRQITKTQQTTTPITGMTTTTTRNDFFDVPPPPIFTDKPLIPDFGRSSLLDDIEKKGKKAKQPKRYTPSAAAAVFGIRGKPSKAGVVTGLGIRPIKNRKKIPKKRKK